MLAVGALEQKFWDAFCEVIHLDPGLRDDAVDPKATASRIAEIVASDTADTWARRIEGRDCCCSIVSTVEEAMHDPHVVARGVFRHLLRGENGQTLPALPVPVDDAFRGSRS